MSHSGANGKNGKNGNGGHGGWHAEPVPQRGAREAASGSREAASGSREAGSGSRDAAGGARPVAALSVTETLRGQKLVVFGGTGFLGKVWLALVLDRYPDIGKLYLVVRQKGRQTPSERFWATVISSEVFRPMRERLGEEFDAFIRAKVEPIDGDVVRPLCGLAPELVQELHGKVAAVVNVAGVVDFSPPLDEALEVNAYGVQNLMDLSRGLGKVPILHTSTCYVAGNRVGLVKEIDPRVLPFPRADELEREHWDPGREIAECQDLVRQARQRCDDAFRQSGFLDEAKQNLLARNEPAHGDSLQAEYQKVRRKFVEAQLVAAGTERAQFWGWPNIYTYTKSIGEQVLAAGELPYTIVRPAIIESSLEFPFPGWNEGINTSAPLAYGIVQGLMQLPSGEQTLLDIIPVDMVAAAMVLALAALVDGTAAPVYQAATSDSNGAKMKRVVELTSLYKRKHYQKKSDGNRLLNLLQSHIEAVPLSPEQFQLHGAPAIGKVARSAAWLLKKASIGPAALALKPAAKKLGDFGQFASKTGELIEVFLPFITNEYIYSCQNTRDVYARLDESEQAKLPWWPERIDWRHYWIDVHMGGLEKWIFPLIDEKQKRALKPARRHETLVTMLDEMADRHDLLVALARLEDDGLSRITYREVCARSLAVAARLQAAGVKPKERVLISGHNHPSWPIAYFGILRAGAVAVPVDATLETALFVNVLVSSEAKVALWDEAVEEKSGRRAREACPGVRVLGLHEVTLAEDGLRPKPVEVASSDMASLIFTSGTTGTPKGVMLTHDNFTSLVASLIPLFPLTSKDRVLSVLPLHHTFEFTCGMLLPLASGARIVYLDELNGETLSRGLKEGRVTAMVGVPALWQMLERKIVSGAQDKGVLAERYLEWGTAFNRMVGQQLGLDLGRVLFGSVHRALGGNIRMLVSGAAALPESTQQLFAGLGLHLAEGYGLTEAAPVLTVQPASPKAKAGSVGKPIPGIELQLHAPDERGVGEIVARGPNIMLGYANDIDGTKAVIDDEGWLHTGDLGRFDKQGRLSIVGRIKDVIVNASGENVYPDDVETVLGPIRGISEYAVVGIEDPSGGERVALLARPDGKDDEDRVARNERATSALRDAIAQLPMNQRPVVVQLYDAELPKTATRKVKRSEVKKVLQRIVAAQATILQADEATTPIRAVVASLAKKKPSEIGAATRLQADLGFDSLMMVDLVLALEQHLGSRRLPEDLSRVETVGEIEKLLGEAPQVVKKRVEASRKDEHIELPQPVQELVKDLLGRGQRAFYDKVMETRVTGRAYIPHNKSTIVIANHASHLDMGLVKYALGAYGDGIVSFAAADYFFDDKWKRAYFENFTNLAALDRKASMARTLRAAGDILLQGKTVLIFPEGTRSPDGQLREFKRLFAHLALTHGVDILPMYLRGTHEAMPKGGKLPTRRTLGAHIGPPLRITDLERLVGEVSTSEKIRRIAEVSRYAVEALRDGTVVDLTRMQPDDLAKLGQKAHPLVSLFAELEARFQKGAVDAPVSFYFTLGNEPEAKWTCTVDRERCVIAMGKPKGGVADCVLKTSADLFTRIVREAYVPGVQEFMSGAIKSNDISLLGTFQKVFNLTASA